MNTTPSSSHRAAARDMDHVIEPLASFICATEHPEMVLKLALAALYSQIEQTNRTANEHVAAFLERRVTVSA